MKKKSRRSAVYCVNDKDFDLIIKATRMAEKISNYTKERVDGCKKREVIL